MISAVPPQEEAEIHRLIADEMSALCMKDLSRLMSYYTDDVVFFNCRRPLLCLEGADALRRMWENYLPHIPDSLRAEIREVKLWGIENGGIIACGRLRFTGAEVDLPERPHTALYRRVGGEWRVASTSTFLPFKPGTEHIAG